MIRRPPRSTLLSLHDALPISRRAAVPVHPRAARGPRGRDDAPRRLDLGEQPVAHVEQRSEEHTSELQSRLHLVCRLLLEKKKKKQEKSNYRRIGYRATHD